MFPLLGGFKIIASPDSTSVWRDRAFAVVLRVLAAISIGTAAMVVFFVAAEAQPTWQRVGFARLLVDESWHPTRDRFGMLPMVVGTVAVAAGAVLVTAPLGIGSALFLRFYAPRRIATGFRRTMELLAGVPSVVFGLWGMTVLVPWIADWSPLGQGQSLLAGVLVLTMMTLPTVALAADAAIGAVPTSYHQGAVALGLSRRAVAFLVVLPAARSGIVTGVVLQSARALGETMVVLMVCGNIVQLPGTPFDPIRTLTANIALEMGYADEQHRAVLFVSGLLLLVMVAGVVATAELVDRRSAGKRAS